MFLPFSISPFSFVFFCLQSVLNNATQETDNPDLRDRAYVYWRLLSTDPEAAKDIVLAEKPTISDEASGLDPDLLNELIRNIATLASVYQKPPAAFVSHLPAGGTPSSASGSTSTPLVVSEEHPAPSHTNDSSAPVPLPPQSQIVPDMLQDEPPASAPTATAAAAPAPKPAGADLLGDLMGLDAPAPPAAVAAATV